MFVNAKLRSSKCNMQVNALTHEEACGVEKLEWIVLWH